MTSVSDNTAPKQHLDAYLSKNTSEDNESFAQILEESDKKHREKHAWLFENEANRKEVDISTFTNLPSVSRRKHLSVCLSDHLYN